MTQERRSEALHVFVPPTAPVESQVVDKASLPESHILEAARARLERPSLRSSLKLLAAAPNVKPAEDVAPEMEVEEAEINTQDFQPLRRKGYVNIVVQPYKMIQNGD